MILLYNFKDVIVGKYNFGVDFSEEEGQEVEEQESQEQELQEQELQEQELQELQKENKTMLVSEIFQNYDYDYENGFNQEVIIENQESPKFLISEEINEAKLQAEREVLESSRQEIALIKEELKLELEYLQKQKNELLEVAEIEATSMKEKAYTLGIEEGYRDGEESARKEHKERVATETVKLFQELKTLLEDMENQKQALIASNIEELKDVTIAIAEKILHISLKSSGDVIKKMIIHSTDKIKAKNWAKVYISKLDASMLIQADGDLLKELSSLSEHVEIITIENATLGTCIIELPDQVIDASTNTQLSSIRDIMSGIEYSGGHNV